MPSVKKHRRKKMQSVSHNKKNLKRKIKKQKSANIASKQIRDSWNASKTVKQNLSEMGLAFDPNKALPIKRKLPTPRLIVDEVQNKTVVQKPVVVKEMEIEANLGEKEKKEQLPSDDVHFCITMMDKFKEDYKAMSRDRTNHYQLTAKQIRDKIRKFKRCKSQYKAYMDSKQEQSILTTQDVEMTT